MAITEQPLYDRDVQTTKANQERLRRNHNLMYWYRRLYDRVLGKMEGLADKSILEIGTGASPLKRFYPQVVTSDVMALEHLDHVFDCHSIDTYGAIGDASVDIVIGTNVLHHLHDPLLFLKRVTRKLKPGGSVILVEPFFSAVSYPIYRFLHHEPVDFTVDNPRMAFATGPLSASNQAVPYLLFFSKRTWLKEIRNYYDLDRTEISYFSSLSYFLSGGVSRVIPVPSWIYRPLLSVDQALTGISPKLFASFFIVQLRTPWSAANDAVSK